MDAYVLVPVTRKLPPVEPVCKAPAASVEPNLSVPFSVKDPPPVIADVPTSSVDKEATEKLTVFEIVPELLKVWVPDPTKFTLPTPVLLEVSVIVPAVKIKLPVILSVPLPAPAPEDSINCPPVAFMLKSRVTFTVVLPVVLVCEPEVLVELWIKSLPIVTCVFVPVVAKTKREDPRINKSVPIVIIGF